jgi:hypothetical protein
MVCEQATNEERARAVSLLRLPIVLYGPSIRRKRHENVMSIVMGYGLPTSSGGQETATLFTFYAFSCAACSGDMGKGGWAPHPAKGPGRALDPLYIFIYCHLSV